VMSVAEAAPAPAALVHRRLTKRWRVSPRRHPNRTSLHG
jgi:hypothetical protein